MNSAPVLLSSYAAHRIRKVLVANRGEIAVRVIRAVQELGMLAVAVYSDADRDSLAVQMADEAVHIGPSHASKSYLNSAAILTAARDRGVEAIHPGYGFLSENADFAQAVTDAGMIFVGPDAITIRTMGDKAAARSRAQLAGVPTVPGSAGELTDIDNALQEATRIGYPMLIKAVAGGGGRGIRLVHNDEELRVQFALAQAEAQAAFGNGGLYLERFITAARHIEVQILGDGKDAIHLYERECSLQRRRQKILEEAPSPALTPAIREALCASAVALAKSIGYRGVGTLEYLYDQSRCSHSGEGEFFFIEMNTRIQVEHPITEAITGVDLVREMLRIADGEPLRLKQEQITLRGAAIECRINAEDPERQFMPGPGLVGAIRWPGGPGIRIDSMLFPGCVVPPYYDSLLAKLVVWDENRAAALARMRRALKETQIEGVTSTTSLHLALLQDQNICKGLYHTNYLEAWMEAWMEARKELKS